MAESTTAPANPGRKRRRAGFLIVGLLLIVGGSVGLLWNEWRSARAVATLLAGERSLLSVDPGRVPGDGGGRLVHLAGPARPSGVVDDPLFGIGTQALRLDRIVEMYQWREHTEGSGDNRTTRYEQVWAEGRIASERFRERVGHANPPAPSFASERFHPAEVALGAYGIDRALTDLLAAEAAIAAPSGRAIVIGGVALRGLAAAFHSGDTSRPSIGDVRVRFSAVPAGEISVLGGLVGSVIGPWTAPNGGSIAMAEPGIHSARDMLRGAYRGDALYTWGLRLAGVAVLFIGSALVLRGLRRRRPEWVRIWTTAGPAAALTIALAWALVLIALAWTVLRPLMSLGLVVASVLLLALASLSQVRRGDSTQQPTDRGGG